ncbi:hypothetical protein [Paraburkholderia megapolitana]|uniref:Uncharacterized protein n=1 Tax=Paraburkholderia megapolitana TaxID=420953 RepID=A0A1I3JJ62_9BURK|nr:hypothetical protein [Paraburkholderia megapolitana]QDQ84777.1 hypothetical protein FNZ07_27340 [Paraburkholderia megapolitana]SFI60312.1 hypothetical protein SAMN05192543_103730 [Paraburkholderia megapolitana]
MQLEVSLAGFSSPWSFRGSKPFCAWAEAKPWLHEGGVCVIRTENAEIGDLLLPSVARFIHGINGGERRLDVRRILCGDRFGTPIQALLHDFELDPEISPFEARPRIKSRLLDRSLLLVFIESASVNPCDWENLIDLLEYYRKATDPVRLCALVFDDRGVVNSAPVCDYLSGHTSHPVFADTSSISTVNALWPSYLHHRVAWEAGGSLDYALSLNKETEDSRVGDDEELERRIQTHAGERLASHPGREALYELVCVGKEVDRLEPARRQVLRAELFAKSLLWRPPSMNGFHVVPWASRALLALPSLAKNKVWALRHQLVCAPLAAEILSLCLKFESQIQSRLHGRQDPNKVSTKTVEAHQRFKDGNDYFVVYPNAFPIRPERVEDLWAFASLGENLKSCPAGAVSDLYWDALHLRNAIAHGHYVGWRHVEWAYRMLESFDTSA